MVMATSLLSAVLQGDLPRVKADLQASEDFASRQALLGACDQRGRTALLIGVVHEYPNIVSLLLSFKETDGIATAVGTARSAMR